MFIGTHFGTPYDTFAIDRNITAMFLDPHTDSPFEIVAPELNSTAMFSDSHFGNPFARLAIDKNRTAMFPDTQYQTSSSRAINHHKFTAGDFIKYAIALCLDVWCNKLPDSDSL